MLTVQSRRLSRPRLVFYLALLLVALYCLVLRTAGPGYHVSPWPQGVDLSGSALGSKADADESEPASQSDQDDGKTEEEKWEASLKAQFQDEEKAAGK